MILSIARDAESLFLILRKCLASRIDIQHQRRQESGMGNISVFRTAYKLITNIQVCIYLESKRHTRKILSKMYQAATKTSLDWLFVQRAQKIKKWPGLLAG